MLQDTAKFSTYIPFPTIAADNPKYNPRGYWRGPIWLDQTYFAIRGLRNYGYHKLAAEYTLQAVSSTHLDYESTSTFCRLEQPNPECG